MYPFSAAGGRGRGEEICTQASPSFPEGRGGLDSGHMLTNIGEMT